MGGDLKPSLHPSGCGCALCEVKPTHDGLRLAVQWRMAQGQGDVLAVMSGVSLATLQRFAATGEISAQDRAILEVLQ